MPGEVRLAIGVRVGDRRSHPRLCGEVDDDVDRLAVERLTQRFPVGDVRLAKDEAGRRLRERSEPRLLERDVVVGVEVVDADHVIAAGGKCAGGVVADEARNPGDQYPQLSPRRRV